MHPLLVKIGPISIHTYGFLIAVGFLCAIFTMSRLAKRQGLDVERVLDLAFWTLLIGFAGSRILFVITRWDYFMANPIDIFKVWEGGLVFFGGPLAVFPFMVWYLRKHQLPIFRTMDAMIPGLVVAHAFGRMGCLAAGCCYGKPTDAPWGIRLYSDLVDAHLRGVPLHPTQIYESFSLFVLFFGLLWLIRRKVFDGQVVLTYFIVYPIIRSIVETFRGDLIRGFVIEDVLSTSQFISLLLFLVASAGLFFRLKYLSQASAKRK